jgi:hypothetical protein
MLRYRVERDYAAVLDGRRYRWRRGDVVELDLAQVRALSRDMPQLVDWGQPLSDEQALEVQLERARADEEFAAEQRLRKRLIREHLRQWQGRPMCQPTPGREPIHPAGELVVVRRPDGEYRVVCAQHAKAAAA